MTIREYAESYPEVGITPMQLACGEYLERADPSLYRLGATYGYSNAEHLAWDLIAAEYECPECGGYGSCEVRSDIGDVPCKKCGGDGIYTGRVIREAV